MRARLALAALLPLAAVAGCLLRSDSEAVPPQLWHTLEPGLELGTFAAPRAAELGDSRIRVLRIDPRRFELVLLNASGTREGQALTAREWCRRHGLVAAINASMYQEDLRTSVSLMRTREHANNRHVTRDMTVLAFDPREAGLPPVKIIDLECERLEDWQDKYGTLIQSIRMLSCNRRNVWQQQPRRFSTSAIGTDRQGRVLFVHVRSPFSTHDLIDMLTQLDLELERLMYTEGGEKAQLYVAGPDGGHEFVGSFETALDESGNNREAWPLPNVVGVARRAGPAAGPQASVRAPQ
jgi:hypothetical protein